MLNPSRGRPRNFFNLTPEQYRAWQSSREWFETNKLETLLAEGSAVGVNLANPNVRVEFTEALPYGPDSFWVKAQRVTGEAFTPPMPIAREDVPDLLEKWNLQGLQWAEGRDIAQATFSGSPPRALILNPGPYWYLSTSRFTDDEQKPKWCFHHDKRGVSAGLSGLAVLMGPRIQTLGALPCSQLPTEGEEFLAASRLPFIEAVYKAATKFFKGSVLSQFQPWKPFEN